MDRKEVSDHAKALSSLGSSKGGKARADSLTEHERKEIASKAARARWQSDVPRATHTGELTIGDIMIPCAVLADGTRVLTQEGFFIAIGRSGKPAKGRGSEVEKVAPFLDLMNLKPFVSEELASSTKPFIFRVPSGGIAYGYRAELLPQVCDVYLRAREAGELLATQEKFARACEILVRGLARVGIVALIDEATGFQYDRSRTALEQILEAFIKDELGKWARRFPDEFYRELFRLKGLLWPSDKNPPQFVGHWTNDLVYKRLAPGVLDDLRQKTPKTQRGHRKNKFHQWLTDDVGHPKLQEHISAVVALMKSSDDWDDFHKRLNRALPIFKPMPLLEWADKRKDDQT